MAQEITLEKYDWYDEKYVKSSIYLDNSTLEALKQVTEETIYNHLKSAIGKVTPLNDTKYLPCLEIGEIALSIQLNYQLWSIRQEGHTDYADFPNEPMTEAEFYQLIADYDDWFDFLAWKDNRTLFDATSTSINRLMRWIKRIYQDKIIEEM